ncbi:MAG TPA: hypothetical protein VMF35_14470 [Acidimicrobiales bacterium]|nr:hypothetical protein [Acidimicrobiales bacterium]
MPTVTIGRPVTISETAESLQQKLGSKYEVTTHLHGNRETLKVKESTTSFANVHLDTNGDTTTFHVHGGGLLISRLFNELGIAKKVAAAINEAMGSVPSA